MQRIAMLGTGFIGRFYADSLQGYRSKDKIVSVYSRREESVKKFAEDYGTPFQTTNMEEAIAHPDVTIVCGKEEYLDNEYDTLLNPTVLFEVLSPSTESYDRGIKFKLYRSIPSLTNYVLISSIEYAAEVYTRIENDEWRLNTVKGKDTHIYISAINYNLSLEDVYSQVNDLR